MSVFTFRLKWTVQMRLINLRYAEETTERNNETIKRIFHEQLFHDLEISKVC